MKYILALLLALVACAQATAAQFTLTITGPNVGTYTKSYNVPDSDAARILVAWGAKTGQQTPQAIVDAIAEELLSQVNRETEQHDKQIAAQAAIDAVPPIQAVPAQ